MHNEEAEPDPEPNTEPVGDDFGNIFDRLRDIIGIPESVDIEQFITIDDCVQVAGELTAGNILQQVS